MGKTCSRVAPTNAAISTPHDAQLDVLQQHIPPSTPECSSEEEQPGQHEFFVPSEPAEPSGPTNLPRDFKDHLFLVPSEPAEPSGPTNLPRDFKDHLSIGKSEPKAPAAPDKRSGDAQKPKSPLVLNNIPRSLTLTFKVPKISPPAPPLPRQPSTSNFQGVATHHGSPCRPGPQMKYGFSSCHSSPNRNASPSRLPPLARYGSPNRFDSPSRNVSSRYSTLCLQRTCGSPLQVSLPSTPTTDWFAITDDDESSEA